MAVSRGVALRGLAGEQPIGYLLASGLRSAATYRYFRICAVQCYRRSSPVTARPVIVRRISKASSKIVKLSDALAVEQGMQRRSWA
jgi:hypothetical protein